MKTLKKILLIPVFAALCVFFRIDSAAATDYPFSVTTTSLTANSTVKFQMATKGTFYVDCGSGGTLSGTGVSGTTITQSSATATVYTCTYSTAGTKTIQFGGLATGYNSSGNDISTSTLTFWVGSDDTERAANATKISSISGCLGTIFPTLGSGNTSQPTFYMSFRNTNITSIPSNLFNGVTGERESMFSWTFRGTKITSIPGNLFSGVSGCGDAMFNATFRDCTSLTAIPDGLFSGVNCAFNYMFGNTFNGDSGLTGYIPPSAFSGLINAGHPNATNLFANTFGGTNLATTCPSGTTQYITGYEGSGYQTWDGKVSCQPSGPVTITYSCGSGSGNAPTDSNSPYTSGTSVTTLSNTCTPPNGQMFTKWNCGGTAVNAGSTFIIYVNTTCTAQYAYNYTVTYACGSGSGIAPSAETVIYNSSFAPASNTCTVPANKQFIGWLVSGTNDIVSGTFTWVYAENKTLTAQYQDQYTGSAFSVTTTSIPSGGTFSFYLSAKGTFSVDCGDGGTLSGTGVSGTIITKTNTSNYTYTCTYSTNGVKTISFDGNATEYNTSESTAAISFNTSSKTYVSSLSGDLSTIFPPKGTSNGQIPRFYFSFASCTNLTSIPSTLFSGYTTGISSMFRSTFEKCSGLTTLPDNLFASITVGATELFRGTFYRCTGLTSIPGNLFSGITSGTNGMFYSTFLGCTSLTSLPENLFRNVTSGTNQTFLSTFYECTGLTGYIPPSMFAGLIANGSPYTGSGSSSGMMHDIFYNTGSLRTSCPSGTTQYITGYEDYWSGHVSCTAPVTCSSGYYLPAGSETCTTCPSGKTCPGGTFNFNASTNQGISINLTWYDGNSTISGPTSCAIGGVFLPPTPPARTGYIFNGWKIKSVNP